MPFAAIGWPDVAIALIAGLPGILAAVAALRVHKAIQTPSKTPIGKQVEDVNHTARSNWHTLDAVRKDVGTELPSEAHREADSVDGLNGH